MTPDEFKKAIETLSYQVSSIEAKQQASNQLAEATAERVDGIVKGVQDSMRNDLRVIHGRMDRVVTDIRMGLREDLQVVMEPFRVTQSSHTKKLDDHETRIRDVEKKGIRRDMVIGGVASSVTLAFIEGLRFLQKLKGGG